MDSLKIREVFIFNTKLKSPKKKPSDDEAQDAKLLYYYPEDTEILVKRSNIGIVEGTLSFMQAFEKVDSNFLYTELNKTYFIADGFENDFIIGFILDKENSKTFNKFENLDTKKKWLKELLNNFYETFILFHNKLSEFFLNKETPDINLGLPGEKSYMVKDFVENYCIFFKSMKMPILNNLQYFTLNSVLQSGLLLSIQRLKEKVPHLKMATILYKGKLVHNQLPFEVISLIYNIFFSSLECSAKCNSFTVPNNLQHVKVGVTPPSAKEENEKGKKEGEKIEKEEKKEETVKTTEDSTTNNTSNDNCINEGNKNEIKEENFPTEEAKNIEEEKKEKENENKIDDKGEEANKKYTKSPYMKILNIKNSEYNFLTGIFKDNNPNAQNETEKDISIFIPTIYIKELDQEYYMIIYSLRFFMFFLFFDKNFEILKNIEQIEKLQKRINKYFKEQFNNIKELDKNQSSENNNIFCYKNSCNKSIKFNGFINKKNNNSFDWKLLEVVQKSLFINGDTEMTSLAKYKGGYYIYFIQSIGQEVVMLFKDGLSLNQVKQEIEKNKKNYFDNLFLG